MAESEVESPEDEGPSMEDDEYEAGFDESTGIPNLAIPHLILAGTTGWAMRYTDTSAYYVFGAYTLSMSYAVLGTFRYAHVGVDKSNDAFYYSFILTTPAVLPLINSELYLKSGFAPYFGYIFLTTAALSLITEFIDETQTVNAMDGVFIFNIGALIYFIATEQKDNWIYSLAAISVLGVIATKLREEINCDITLIAALGISIFNFAAVNCLTEL